MSFLLRHAPSHLHLVLTTRLEPPLSLGGLLAKNRLLEVDASVLRFDYFFARPIASRVACLHPPRADGADRDPRYHARPGLRWLPHVSVCQRTARDDRRAAPLVRHDLQGGDLRTALWRRQVGDDRRPAPRQDAGAASRDGSHHRGPRRPLHHRRRRGHNARGLDHHAGSDVPYCRSDGGRAASLARDRVRRVRGPARRCGGLPRPQRLGGAASRRPGAGQCRYAIVRLLVGGGGGIGGQ